MAEKPGYTYMIFEKRTPYEKIVEAYSEAMERGKKSGFTPVLVPVDNALGDFWWD